MTHTHCSRWIVLLTMLAILASVPLARADGLADLHSALKRLAAETPLQATVEVMTNEHLGDGADAINKQGQARVGLNDDARGLQVLYAKDTLARVDDELRHLAHDVNFKTPTVWALFRLDQNELAPMASAVPEIARNIDEFVFKGERADVWNGRPARLLTFAIPVTRVPAAQRKYVKDFDGTLSIWIAADGMPLASETHVRIKGRAFVVISFEAVDETKNTYGVVGDRLLMLRSEHHNASSGAGERIDMRTVKVLELVALDLPRSRVP